MSDINIFTATGRLTRAPEIRYLANDKAVAKVGIAISRSWTKDGQKQEETLFIDGEAWGKLAEIICQYCGKGKQVAVMGRLKLDTWEKDGQKRSKIALVIEQLTLLGSRDGAVSHAEGAVSEPAPRRPSSPAREAESDVGQSGGEEPPF
jgi:single-strand DNA-binding protein